MQAVVSNDRRFVRLTVVPFFSQIGDVEEFTFTGSKTTSKKSSDTAKAKGDDEDQQGRRRRRVSEEGTTVQLPTFSFVTVTTTVSVPDGGTVLLGGIKRLNENRTERGLPILSKIPYINRLFKNVGIGRTTSSLMMMVTPRIIIQEEEEEKLIGTAGAVAPHQSTFTFLAKVSSPPLAVLPPQPSAAFLFSPQKIEAHAESRSRKAAMAVPNSRVRGEV